MKRWCEAYKWLQTYPSRKLLEGRVQLDIFKQELKALIEGLSDTVEHLLESIPERTAVVENVLVSLPPKLNPEAQVVGHPVIAVLEGDCSIEIGEKDGLGLRAQGRK